MRKRVEEKVVSWPVRPLARLSASSSHVQVTQEDHHCVVSRHYRVALCHHAFGTVGGKAGKCA